MLSSRNIHFVILGIIIGGALGYIFAFYQVQASMPAPAPPSASNSNSNMPNGHPNVSKEQILAMFKEALEKNPNDTTLMTKYANFLFDTGKFSEAVTWFEKVVALQPDSPDAKTDFGTALWNAGEKDKAMAQYQAALKLDPRHMATLHNLTIVYEEDRKLADAEKTIKQMETIDPKYEGLDTLKKRLDQLKASK
jgi:tetratricopeptide (TPR) repeat protein